MDTVVLIGLLLGVFGGFQTTTSAIRSFFKEKLVSWFDTADNCIEQLESGNIQDTQKKSPKKFRKRMDYWLLTWKFGHAVPLFLFSAFSIGLSLYCACSWPELFKDPSPDPVVRQLMQLSYQKLVIVYTTITFISFLTALYALWRLKACADRLREDCATALGDLFKAA